MKITTAFLVMTSIVSALVGNGCGDERNAAKRDGKDDRPFFAVWSDDSPAPTGLGAYHGPYLRFAFWDDGRVVFAKTSEKRDTPLRRGRIATDRVDRLKRALLDSGVFVLKGNCYLVPDAGCISMTLELGKKKQTLYWDEIKSPNFGINTDSQPQHREFIRCWEALNSLGLAARPDKSETIKEDLRPQPSWSLRPRIQSE